MKMGLLKLNKKLKMRLLGLLLVTTGATVLIYSLFYASSNTGFWTIYIGLLLLISGLGFLGINIGSYPF